MYEENFHATWPKGIITASLTREVSPKHFTLVWSNHTNASMTFMQIGVLTTVHALVSLCQLDRINSDFFFMSFIEILN